MKRVLLLLIGIVIVLELFAQNKVGIGTTNPHNSAMLEISSSDKGVLIPRLSKAQKDAIVSPAKGLLIFQDDVDSTGFYYHDGIQWLWMEVLGSAGWKTKGNSGMDTAVNFIGTTDDMPIRFKQNGIQLGHWDLGKSNYYLGRAAGKNNTLLTTFSIGIGDSALYTNTNANHNVAIGFKALKLNQVGSSDIAIGSFALENLQGTGVGGNTALGVSSLRQARNVQFNTAIGTGALQEHRDSASNTAIGFQSLTLDTTGSRNVAVGVNTLGRNANGSRNVAVGNSAGFNNSSGSRNTYIGHFVNGSQSVFNYDQAYTGSNNTAMGAFSFYNNVSGNSNVAIGDSAGFNNSTASSNIYIGRLAGFSNTTRENFMAIGDSAGYFNVSGSDQVFIGNNAGKHHRINSRNTFVGVNAGYSDSIGFNNTFIGQNAGFNTKGTLANSGVNNTFIGQDAGFGNTTGNANTYVGNNAGERATGTANTYVGQLTGSFQNDGSFNTFVGAGIANNGLTGTANSNTIVGYSAGADLRSSLFNVFLGNSAGANDTSGVANVAVGSAALANSLSSENNIALGSSALGNNQDGQGHVAIGSQSMFFDTTHTTLIFGGLYPNTAVGFASLKSNKDGTGNSYLGSFSGANIDRGQDNTAMGTRALSNSNFVFTNNFSSCNAAFGFESLLRVQNADSNSAFGYRSLASNISGNKNAAFGSNAMTSNSSGSFNTAAGGETLLFNISGSKNTALGFGANVLLPNLTNATAIGAHAAAGQSNSLILGSIPGVNGGTTHTNTGIGITTPQARLHINNNSAVSNAKYIVNATAILENSLASSMLQMMTPAGNLASINSGTDLTVSRSAISFKNDSSIAFATGGANDRVFFDKKGFVGIGTSTPQARLHVADSSVLFSGAMNFDNDELPATGAGVRLMWIPHRAVFRAGSVGGAEWNIENTGDYSFAAGSQNIARGPGSAAFGGSCFAGGIASFVSGQESVATGINGVAMGANTNALGLDAAAFNASTRATGSFSFAAGLSTVSRAYSSFTVGQFNDSIISSSTVNWVATDPLFIVGNGTALNSRNNALTILKNGRTGINTSSPDAMLHTVRNNPSGGPLISNAMSIFESNTSSYIQLSTPTATENGILSGNTTLTVRAGIVFNADSSVDLRSGGNFDRIVIKKDGKIGMNTANPQSLLHLKALSPSSFDSHIRLEQVGSSDYASMVYDGDMKFRTFGAVDSYMWRDASNNNRMVLDQNGNLTIMGTLTENSDARLKKDIVPLQYGLNKILSLKGYHYHWIAADRDNALQTGVLAQEVEKVMPELVRTDEYGTKSVNYNGMVPYLIESVRELKKENDELRNKIDALIDLIKKN